ncbi:transmembrane protein 53-like [Lineus longissimus]|uniref:transmembrane protein 53-like n=1 Tax=Lineus longissimus TaxID=88925 RepID=UPI002B4D54B4
MAEIADDDIDFVVEFPSPTPNLDDDGADEAMASMPDDGTPVSAEANIGKQPVIVLLGWMNCQDKHLAKYSEIYEKKGCVTIRYIVPIEDLFYNQSTKLKRTATKLLDLLYDMELEENQLFFHVFSNGGGYVYRNITEQLHSNTKYRALKLKGCVFDSCPSPGNSFYAAMALASSYNGSIVGRYIYAFLTLIYLLLFRVWEQFIWTFRSLKGQRQFSGVIGYYNAMLSDPSPCPQLYLYSKADRMIKYSAIERVIKHRSSRGIEVTSVCWDDSDHVSHLRAHRESYMKKCYDFIDSCTHR